VLGGGLGVQRIIHAVQLYEKNRTSRIILTGQEMEFDYGKIQFKGIKLTEPRLASMLAKLYGVPEETLFLEERPHNTHEDAKYVKEALLDMGIHSATVVSDPYHMRRVSMAFRKEFKNTDISLTFSPADDTGFRINNWWSAHEIKLIVSEYIKIAYYLIRY